MSDRPVLTEFREQHGWSGLHSLVKIRRQREIKGVRSEQIAYYISSLTADAATVLTAVRRHWAVENECHWVLDLIFDEDRSRIRLGESPENFSLIRQFALSILKRHPAKGSLNSKRFRAALDAAFRLSLLQSFHALALPSGWDAPLVPNLDHSIKRVLEAARIYPQQSVTYISR